MPTTRAAVGGEIMKTRLIVAALAGVLLLGLLAIVPGVPATSPRSRPPASAKGGYTSGRRLSMLEGENCDALLLS